MADRFSSELDNFECSLMQTVELGKKYGSPEYQNKNIYNDIIDKICAVRAEAKLVSDIVQCTAELSTVAELETIIFKAKTKPKIKGSEKHNNLRKQINEILNPSEDSGNTNFEDDDMYVQAEISPIDPITKQNIKNPVKNKICNHYYEKTTILEIIKQNPRLKCPMVGCGNKNVITINNLVEDFELMQKLKRSQN